MFAFLAMGLAIARASSERVVAETGEDVVVEEGEIVEETLIVGARSLRIAGTVDGDVVASAEHIVVSGTIRGNLTVAARTVEVDVDGIVEGTLHCACQDFSMRGRVERNLYAAGESLAVTGTGEVVRDAVLLGASTRMDGVIGRDLRTYAQSVAIGGRIGRNIEGATGQLLATADADVGGDIDMTVADRESVDIDARATIAGATTIEEDPDMNRSPYLRAGWWVMQVLQLLSAFVVGLLLVRLWPQLFVVSRPSSTTVLVSMGIGLLVLMIVPLLSVVVMFTVIGLPLGLISLVTYAIALYLAGIVVAVRLGTAILGERRRGRTTLALGVGLLILAVATELPWIGGLIGFVTVLLGLGIIYRAVKESRVATAPGRDSAAAGH